MIGMKAAEAELTAARTGEPSGVAEFEVWMKSEQKRIFLLCLRMLRSPDDADSATQDTFLKAFRSFKKPSGAGIENPAGWITRIAVNTCFDLLRSRRWQFWKRRTAEENEKAFFEVAAADGLNAEDRLRAREIEERLANSLESLSIRQRAIFILRHEEDRSLEDIGDILGLDIGTVKSHLSRALKKLREELSDLYVK